MLKALRRRFIAIAMAAISAVVLVVVCGVNLWNYRITTDQQDATLQTLLLSDDLGMLPFGAGSIQPYRDSGEMAYMVRFFVVHCDRNGQVRSINQDYIASVTGSDATAFATHVLRSGKAAGYYRGYRFLSAPRGFGTTLIFLNSQREIQSMRALLLTTAIIGMGCMGAVFLLVLLCSGKAIAPFVRNLQTQKQFITDAGHELKTPLTAISTSADILAMEYPEDEWVENIRGQSQRLTKLVQNLLTLSRLDEEQPFPTRTDFSLSQTVWEIAEPAAAQARAKGKRFCQDIAEDIPFHGDQNAMGQLVSTLLDNAIRYSDEEGNICLTLRRAGRKIELSVSNTCTLPAEVELNRLFDRFYRPDKSRAANSGGSGIGLSIARAITEAHGGTIRASYTPPTITFRVLL